MPYKMTVSLLLAAAVLQAVMIVYLKHQQRTIYKNIHHAQGHNVELLHIRSQLLLESSTLASYKRIERQAREELGMRAPEAWEILWMQDE